MIEKMDTSEFRLKTRPFQDTPVSGRFIYLFIEAVKANCNETRK